MKAIEVLDELLADLVFLATPGTNLQYLENNAELLLKQSGAISCNKGYQPKGAKTPFPSILCLSINDQIAHAPARNYILKDGDLLTIDCGLNVDNFCADAALTILIGMKISSRDERLLYYAKQATKVGISVIKPGVKITEVGKAIEKYANRNGYVIVKKLAGHGIGKTMHEEPTIPMYDIGLEENILTIKGKKSYYYKDYDNIPTFKEGQIVCIEPHLTYKDELGILDDDGWTLRSRDGKRSAMFEHMVRVTKDGSEILI